MKKSVYHWLGVPLAALLAVQLCALGLYVRDQRYLAQLMDSISAPALPLDAQAKQVLVFLRDKPVVENNSYFLFSVFGFLRATPRQVAEQGGDCSDRSRLLIVLLHLRGISASKWALYTPAMQPKHAVVEVDTRAGRMVVDPLFGLWYPRPEGGYYGIDDLRKDQTLFQQRILDLRARHERPGAEKLEEYPLDAHIYRNARSINWDKWAATRVLYRSLRAVWGEKVDWIPRPYWVEQPALMVVIGLGGVEGAVLVFGLLATRLRNRKRASAGAQQDFQPSRSTSAAAATRPAQLGRLPRI